MSWPNLKFVILPVPEIIRGSQKIWAVPEYAHFPFSTEFFMGLCSHGLCECIGQICCPQLYTIPGIIAIAVLWWGCEPQILGKGRP